MLSLKGQSFLALKDFTPRQIRLMLDTAHQFKKNKLAGVPNKTHTGKTIALLFEKNSTRTRCAFVTGARDLGMHAEFLGKDDIQLGKKESVRDTAMVLGRMFDGIEFRGFSHQTVEELAEYAGVPVWNGLTDQFHPTQGLADFMTMEEQLGFLKGAKLAYVGDGRNNVANTLMFASALMGVDFRIAAPRELFPAREMVEEARALAQKYHTDARISVVEDPNRAVSDVDFIYTDVWVSMGEEEKFAERISLLKAYQVNFDLLRATHNKNIKFLHCLPAFHDQNTVFGKQIYEQYGLESMEVTDDVFYSDHSVVFEQAENRVYTIEAVMALTL